MATVTPAGSVSVSDTADSASAPLAVLATEIVSLETPDGKIAAGENALESVTFGAFSTVSTAVAGAALLAPCAVATAPAGIVLVCAPTTTLVTFTAIVLPPVKATLPPPAGAVTAPLPHVVEAAGAVAIVTPDGSVSVSDIAVSAIAPLAVLATEIVRREIPDGAIVEGANALLSVTPGASTVSVAVAGVVLVAPCALDTALDGIVFTCAPAVVPVTRTLTVHVASAATAPALSPMLLAPACASTMPDPHVVDAPGVAATSTPAGSASVTASDVSAADPALVFAIEIVRTEAPSSAMDDGANALVSVTGGAARTVSVAVAGFALVAPSRLVISPAGIVLR